MQNPFAIATQWPDDTRRYLVHLQRPYFTALLHETSQAAWLLVSWAPGSELASRDDIFRAAAAFCRVQLDQDDVPIEFVERRHGHPLPRYVMAQTVSKSLFIVEPEHSAPLVEVHDSSAIRRPEPAKPSLRFDVVTQWRLADMRKYYQQYLERQTSSAAAAHALTAKQVAS